MKTLKYETMGVLIASAILEMKKLNIKVVGSDTIHKNFSAKFFSDLWLILFNKDWLNNANINEIFLASFHETRHAYQKHQVECLDNYEECHENIERVKVWKKEIDNYKLPSGDENSIIEQFMEQDIEIDAIAFSVYLIDKLFHVEVKLTDSIKEKVFERISEIHSVLKLE